MLYEVITDNKIQDIRLYPNPVSSNLHVSSKANVQKVKVYNMLGMLVKNIENNLESSDMSNLSNGTYLLKVFTNEGVVDKIIIKNVITSYSIHYTKLYD